jgi:hypothetical protein
LSDAAAIDRLVDITNMPIHSKDEQEMQAKAARMLHKVAPHLVGNGGEPFPDGKPARAISQHNFDGFARIDAAMKKAEARDRRIAKLKTVIADGRFGLEKRFDAVRKYCKEGLTPRANDEIMTQMLTEGKIGFWRF